MFPGEMSLVRDARGQDPGGKMIGMIETGLENMITQTHTAMAAAAQDHDFGIQQDMPAAWNNQCQHTTTVIYQPASLMVLTENTMAGC